jgi:putative addiction module killer protein
VNTVLRTVVFDRWLAKLKDLRGKARIIERIRCAERGDFGDCASVGNGVAEMRVHFGPGYRVYFCRTDDVNFVLLCGGSKRGQRRDIIKAQAMARRLTED